MVNTFFFGFTEGFVPFTFAVDAFLVVLVPGVRKTFLHRDIHDLGITDVGFRTADRRTSTLTVR